MKSRYRHAAIVVICLLILGTPPAVAIKYVPSDPGIGIWDDVNRIYTLSTDVYETIQIEQDNLTLDGAGHTVTADPLLDGVYVPGRTGVTIRNLDVQGCYIGIYVNGGSGNTLTDNTGSNNHNAIHSDYCSNLTVTNNTASANGVGIWLHNSSNGVVTGNTAVDNYGGGIYFFLSHGCTITDNTAFDNNVAFSLWTAHNNTVTGNTFSDNNLGAAIWLSGGNLIYNNSFIDNARQIFDDSGTGNVYNRPAPEGGNYWSDHTRPDADDDGFVDVPYLIYDFPGNQIGQDDLPWTYEDRWQSAAAKEATQGLVGQVQALGLPKGFYGKLNDAIKVLGDANPNNDSAAINKLNDFIDQVSNNQDAITNAGGDPAALIAEAQAIIAILEAG
jgi:parallel beta-helix repeat protein